MSVLVAIVNYKTAALTVRCLHSLLTEREHLPGLKVSVVENASGDEASLQDALADPLFEGWTELIVADRNGGFAYGNNCAVRRMLREPDPADYVLLLNPDTEVRPGAVQTLFSFMESRPDVGIAGASLENADGSEWPYAFRFPNVFNELKTGSQFGPLGRLVKKHAVLQRMGPAPQPIDWIPGAAMMIRRHVFEDVGLMDERYFLYYEETDFCRAAKRAGWPCWYVPEARVMHIAGQSTGVTVQNQRPPRLPDYWFESRRRYFIKNHGSFYAMRADVAYLAGLAFDRARTKLGRREDKRPPHLFRDLLRNSTLWSKNRRLEPPLIE